MDILLINPKATEEEALPVFPLGLGYIAAVLRNAGHSVRVIDVNASSGSPSHIEARIRQTKFDLLALPV